MAVLVSNRNTELNVISRTSDFFLNIIFSVLVILCLCPLALVLAGSLTSEDVINKSGFSFWPEKFSTLAYHYVLSDATQIFRSYGVSIVITVVGSVVGVLIVALYAYPLSRKDFKYRNVFAFLVFFTMLFNGGLVPWYMVYANLLHLKNSLLGLILPHLVAPFYVLIMKTFFTSSVPESIVESAKMDGAGEVRIFFTIVLKISTPALATIGLFSTIHYWNDWFTALMLVTKVQYMPLQYLLYQIQTTLEVLIQLSAAGSGNVLSMADLPNQSVRMALCIITIGPIVLAYPFFQKYFVKGLTIGAIKG